MRVSKVPDDREAKYVAALEFEAQGNIGAARDLFTQAARAGHEGAMCALAKNLLSCEPMSPQAGVSILRTAAQRGDPEAAHLCAVIAGQDDTLPQHWDIAFDYLVRSAELGSEAAQRQLELLASDD
jgi:TPR repeat protein